MQKKWELPPDMEVNGLLYSYVFVLHGRIRLKVTGSGKIPGKGEYQPWLRYRNWISELWIGEGVTEIGVRAFCGYGWLERLWLPESIQEVGYMAFGCCPRLEEVIYMGTLAQLQRANIPRSALPAQFYGEEENHGL